MSERDNQPQRERSAPPGVAGKDEVVPSGNLFETPGVVALDPADRKERQDVECLLEALDRSS